MPVTVQCPNPECGQALSVTEEAQNKSLRCPYYQKKFRLDPSSAHQLAAPPPLEANAIQSIPQQAVDSPMPKQVGRFQILSRLGAGAFGTVYKGYDPQLDREVTVKVPQAATLENPDKVERFLNEAKSAAQLRHPHIVPIFEAGFDGTHYYIASAFIPGQTLAHHLHQEKIDFRRAATIVRALGEALSYAHSLGIVHRDVKPANVMLDDNNQPHLMDFGLAHRDEGAEKLTHEGTVLGTPAYMAPEQAKGDKAHAASDQYSLGVVLYELLSGRTPFEGPPPVVIFNTIHKEPQSPRQMNSAVPRDLETICLKGLSKQARDRYDDCSELADDLRRWLEGEPIRTRRLGPAECLVRWARRNPAVASLATMLVVILFLGSAVSITFAVWANSERDRANQGEMIARREKRLSEKARLAEKTMRIQEAKARMRAEWLLYTSQLALVQRHWQDGNLVHGRKLLTATQREYRHWEYRYLLRLFDSNQRTFTGHSGAISCVAFAPGGKLVVSGSYDDHALKLWNVQTGRVVRTLQGHKGGVYCMAISPNGQHIVSGSLDRTLKLWDTKTGREIRTFRGHIDAVLCVAFSPNGQRIVSGSSDRTIRVWDVLTGKEVLTLTGDIDIIRSVAFSPDGQRILSSGNSGTLKVWDASLSAK